MEFYPSGSLIADRYEVAQGPNEKPSLKGGMGLVYLCFDHQEQRPVALKTFRPEYLPDRLARDRFLREGSTWVALGHHPHIVRCYQVVRVGDGREVYLVLELIAKEEGRADASLRSWLAPGRPLPVEQALLFALQVTWGMAHAVRVQAGLVHRDLKPENVLIGADRLSHGSINRLRVTDLGLASALEAAGDRWPVAGGRKPDDSGSLGRTQLTHGIVGTPLYMAPEQWHGERVTIATDIYALGCILYEMLAVQPVVEGSTLLALERAHCDGRLRLLPTEVPETVRAVVERCLTIEVEARYRSWEEVGRAVASAYEVVAGRLAPEPEPATVEGHAERVMAGWSYDTIGVSYLDLGKTDVAVGYFERARQAGQTESERRLEATALTHLGVTYKNLGDPSRAVIYHQQAMAISRQIGDRDGEGMALANLGAAYDTMGDSRKSIGYYEQALMLCIEVGDQQGTATALGNLGTAYANLGEIRRAIGFYDQWLEVAREIGDRRSEGTALGNLGTIYSQMGEISRAIGCHEQALVIQHDIGDRRAEGSTLGNLGIAYGQLGDTRRATVFFEQSLAIAHEIRDRRQEGALLGNLGNICRDLGETRGAIGYFEQALTIARQVKDRRGESADAAGLGTAYASLGDSGRAIDYYEQALAIIRETGDRYIERQCWDNLGDIHKKLGNACRAVSCYEKALAIDREMADRCAEGENLQKLGSTYRQLGDTYRAISYCELALTIAREVCVVAPSEAERMRAQRSTGNALGNLGDAYLELGEFRRAISYYEQISAIADEIGERHGYGFALAGLGNAYLGLGAFERAISFFERGLAIEREIGNRQAEGATLGNLGNACALLGDTRRATDCYEQALDIFQTIGDRMGMAISCLNLAPLYAELGKTGNALLLAQQAAQMFGEIGSPNAQVAQQWVAHLQGGGPADSGASPAQILANFGPLIEAAVAGAQGNRPARAAVEAAFDQLAQDGWRIADPIQRLWVGERDEASLTARLDDSETLVVREILERLRG